MVQDLLIFLTECLEVINNNSQTTHQEVLGQHNKFLSINLMMKYLISIFNSNHQNKLLHLLLIKTLQNKIQKNNQPNILKKNNLFVLKMQNFKGQIIKTMTIKQIYNLILDQIQVIIIILKRGQIAKYVKSQKRQVLIKSLI